jgi:tetratricopeptide (TPR) repeat protein
MWRSGRVEDALAELRRAIEIDPDGQFPRYFAGACLVDVGRWEEAVVELRRAVELRPTFSWAYSLLGWAHLAQGSAEASRWAVEKTIALQGHPGEPPHYAARGLLSTWHYYLGNLDEARRYALETLEEIERTDHVYRDAARAQYLCLLGQVNLRRRDQAGARAAFDQAVAQIRGRPRALGGGFTLTQSLAGQSRAGAGSGPLDEAVQLFESRGEFNFSWSGAACKQVTLMQLARAAAALGRDQQVQDLLGRARTAGLTPTLEEPLD